VRIAVKSLGRAAAEHDYVATGHRGAGMTRSECGPRRLI
jgi:hypothetical protein